MGRLSGGTIARPTARKQNIRRIALALEISKYPSILKMSPPNVNTRNVAVRVRILRVVIFILFFSVFFFFILVRTTYYIIIKISYSLWAAASETSRQRREKKTRLSPADNTRRAMNNRAAVNPPKSRPVGDPVAATADAGNPN